MDDDQVDLDPMKEPIGEIDKSMVPISFQNTEEALHELTQNLLPDYIFIDINMLEYLATRSERLSGDTMENRRKLPN